MKINKKRERNKGITLIALIITIIVLLILAGVALASLSGENGLLGRSSQAKEEAIKAQLKEEIQMSIMDIQAEEVSQGRNLTLETLAQKLETHEDLKENIDVEFDGNEITGEYKGYEYTIDQNTNVTITGNSANINNDWRQILILAEVDHTKFSSYEQALEDKDVIEKIVSHQQAVDCLINSSKNIITTTVNCDEMLQKLAGNESSALKIVTNDKWFKHINNSEKNLSFFSNINISGTEELNYVEEENPYYTFTAEANKSYFVQCYGGQGGSYSAGVHGGYGGYSFGIFKPTHNTTLYIYKGGQGKGNIANSALQGGYNGGGAISAWGDGHEHRASGGGATHIALITGLLSTLEDKKSDIIMVAGGGGRSRY